MIVKSSRIYMEDGMKNGFLLINDGKFSDFSEHLPEETGDIVVDYGDMRVIPGIFDTHNHGTCGYGLMDSAGEEEVKGYLKGCASQGVTSVFPTAAPDTIATVTRVARSGYDGAQVLGIHSEGPWLNRTGEHGIRTGWPEVSMDTAKKLVEDADGLLKLVAMAPEIPGTEPLVNYFLSQGVTMAFAHSDCDFGQAMEAYGRGFSVATHTGNVMTGMHHRNVGGLGASLLNDEVMCEVICDGMHVCLDMLKIYFRIKSTDHFMMISDNIQLAGAPVGFYPGFDPGMTLNVTEEGFVLSDTGRLCGSSQPVLYGIKNLVEKLGMPMETVLTMSSLNASRKYGFDREKGSIRKGKDADFVVISDDYEAQSTYVRGRKVYDREKEGRIFNPHFFDSAAPTSPS